MRGRDGEGERRERERGREGVGERGRVGLFVEAWRVREARR